MQSDKKIVFVNTNCGFVGGVESYIHKVAGLLKRDGWKVYGFFEKKAGKQEGFEEPFANVYLNQKKVRNDVLTILRDTGCKLAFIHKISDPELLQIIRKNFKTISFIHDHDYYCLRRHKYFVFQRKNCKLPFNKYYCMACSLGLDTSGELPGLIKLNDKTRLLDIIKRCDVTLAMSDYMIHNLEKNGWNMGKVKKLHPIFEVSERSSKPPNSIPVLLYVGQLIKGKGVDYLLQAVSKIYHPLRLMIIGTGNEEQNLKNLAKSLKLDDRVEFVGWTSEVEKFYKQADVVVVPSRWQEPFGLVGLEAFSYQTPVVGFNVGGITEWLHDKRNGLVAQPRDVKDLAEKIESLLGNQALCSDLGKEGYKFVRDNFTEKQFLARFYEIISEL